MYGVSYERRESEKEERRNHKGIRIISREELCQYTWWNHEFHGNKQFSIHE
jgi:hypothetical protein